MKFVPKLSPYLFVVYTFVYFFVNLFVYLFVYHSVNMSVYFPCISLPISLFFYPSISLSYA